MKFSFVWTVSVVAIWSSLFSAPLRARADDSAAAAVTLNEIDRAYRQSSIVRGHRGFQLSREGGVIVLKYHPRQWLTYTAGMDGTWSKEQRPELGPDSDGIVITIRISDPSAGLEQQADFRAPGFTLQFMDQQDAPGRLSHTLRRPYWSTYGTELSLPKRRVTIFCDINYNNRTSRDLIKEAFAPLAGAYRQGDARQGRTARR